MKIIDAHIHFVAWEHFDQLAIQAGHRNCAGHLQEVYRQLGIAHAVVMGNRSLDLSDHDYPPFMSYCIGMDRFVFEHTQLKANIDLVEKHLQRENCVGIKLYPGYTPKYVYEPEFFPYYELAEHYGKPVAIHTGATASGMGSLRYCHPLTVDDVAGLFPRVQFVMCHFGNPYVMDAAAVLSKNANVTADLSGMLEGLLDMPVFLREHASYVEYLKLWTSYLGTYDRLMFGTDWPLINIGNYIDFIAAVIPGRHLSGVMFDNANRIYRLGL